MLHLFLVSSKVIPLYVYNRLISIRGYYKIMNIVPSAIQ